MPSDVGYPLPPVNQRPQLVNRLNVNENTGLLKVKEDDALKQAGVEQSKIKVVSETREVLDDRFPTESSVDRFRGNTEGRNVNEVPPSLPLTRLPSRVQAFSSLTAKPNNFSTLSAAESAATGLTVPTRLQSSQGASNSVQPTESSIPNAEVKYPSINGSGEIAARFEVIEERIKQRALDEFDALRPGGPESERLAAEKSQSEQVNNEVSQETRQREFNREINQNTERQQENQNLEVSQSEQRQEQSRIEENIISQVNQEAVVVEEDRQAELSQAPIVTTPGEPIDSRGQPLSSQEQQEVKRLEKRDREVRSHEQAHARAGGTHVRGGVQLSYTTGPDGQRYATDGEVNIDLSEGRTPQETVTKMRQVQSAALAPATPSGADRSVAALAARRELDAQAQINEQNQLAREKVAKEQVAGQPAVQRDSNEQASKVEVRENIDHIAGAQSVIPDPSFSPRSSNIEQQSLEAVEGINPTATPESISRPVTAPAKKLAMSQEQPVPSSPRSETSSTSYDRALDKALEGY